MAVRVILQLADSEGLMSVVIFSGLSNPMIMHPALHNEPALTAQAFYYLEEMDSVAQLWFESEKDVLTDGKLDYLIDNYLYEYSKRHLSQKISFKVSRNKFIRRNDNEPYIDVDLGHTRSLALDVQNDEFVSLLEAVDQSDRIDLSDWNIGMNYVFDCLGPYIDGMSEVLEKKVRTFIAPGPERDGYVGKLRVLKTGHGLVDYYQAVSLSDLTLRAISPDAKTVALTRSPCAQTFDELPIERINTNRMHAPILLSHYFSGLKELNPLKAFLSFYNILEYYFEEAPLLLNRTASNELKQLHCVIDMLLCDVDVRKYISDLSPTARRIVLTDISTTSGVNIVAFNSNATGLRFELARWLYDIRCAIVHSKKTRRGQTVPAFEPYSVHSERLREITPIIRWLAIKCIDNDFELHTVDL